MNDKKFAFPKTITGQEIKRYRSQLNMTRKQFAEMLSVSAKTVESWEYSKKPITGPVVITIRMLQEYPEELELFAIPEQKYRLRLWYMYREEPCTVIDVNEGERRVQIKNFTNRVQFRAFGNNSRPSYAEYEAFLESRCFPKSRDKMKLILRDLQLPFYEPLMIIQKTEGRMAEDDFWIKIEVNHG